jgi:hypothetical protein
MMRCKFSEAAMKRHLGVATVLILALAQGASAENEAGTATAKAPQQLKVTIAIVMDYVPQMRLAESKSVTVINGNMAFETWSGFLAYLKDKAPKGSTVILPAGSKVDDMSGHVTNLIRRVAEEPKTFKQFCDELGLKIEIEKE